METADFSETPTFTYPKTSPRILKGRDPKLIHYYVGNKEDRQRTVSVF